MQRAIAVAVSGMAVALAWASHAQPLGPPIPPDQVFRQQGVGPAPPPPPLPGPPPLSVRPSTPPPGSEMLARPRIEMPGDRVARCRHQATVERVPRSQRAAYLHACTHGD